MTNLNIERFDPSIVGPASPTYSQVVVANGVAYLAGQAALDGDDQVVHPGDAYGQTIYALERVRLILEELGADLSRVVSATVFLTSDANFSDYNRAWLEVFAEYRPARATMIAGLVLPGCLVEIIATAVLPAT